MIVKDLNSEAPPTCKNLPGLSAGQSNLCKLYSDHMLPVSMGARQALTECKHQFAHRRWNCSLLDGENVLGPTINYGKFMNF